MNERDDMHGIAGEFGLDEPLPLGVTEPVDVVQVRADDALIAALSRDEHVRIDDPIDDRLAGLLRSWRADVRAGSDDEQQLVDVAAVTAALTATPATPGTRDRRSLLNAVGPLASAAAVLIIAFVGIGLAAKDAVPGDPLFGVAKVLYADKAVAGTIEAKLNEASSALKVGDVKAARSALDEAKEKLTAVPDHDVKQQLESRTEQLEAQVKGGETPPPAPLPTTTSTSLSPEPTPVASPAPTTALTNPSATPASAAAPPPTTTVVETLPQPVPSPTPPSSPPPTSPVPGAETPTEEVGAGTEAPLATGDSAPAPGDTAPTTATG